MTLLNSCIYIPRSAVPQFIQLLTRIPKFLPLICDSVGWLCNRCSCDCFASASLYVRHSSSLFCHMLTICRCFCWSLRSSESEYRPSTTLARFIQLANFLSVQIQHCQFPLSSGSFLLWLLHHESCRSWCKPLGHSPGTEILVLSKKVCASPFLHKVIYPKNFAQVLLPKASCIHGRAGGDVEVPARITSVMIKFVRA